MNYKICSFVSDHSSHYHPIPSSSFITCRHQILRFRWPSCCYIFCRNNYVVNSCTCIIPVSISKKNLKLCFMMPSEMWRMRSISPKRWCRTPNYMASRIRIPYCWYRLENLHTSSMKVLYKVCCSVVCISEDSRSNDTGKTSVSFSNIYFI
jgi:hypothetical protein